MGTKTLAFNGINGATGSYLMPEMIPEDISKMALGEPLDEEHFSDLKKRYQQSQGRGDYVPIEGVDPKDLAQAGWGVIFAYDADPAIRENLSELLEHRKEQAGDRYREYTGADGYRYDASDQSFESKNKFLVRHGSGPGPVDPKIIPYYLLIVGDPQTIPYRFQYQLDVQHAVGRIHFDTLEEYAQYARSVVDAEKGEALLPRQAAFFGVRNPDDRATNLSADHLVKPLAEKMIQDQPTWAVQTFLEAQADKAQLGTLLGGDHTPALLFTASHGMGFPNGDSRQLLHQGALLCQDWPGPQNWHEPIPEEYYFSADDVDANARLLGLITFHFACYGAGTPRLDDFAHSAFQMREEIAPHAFIARLPRQLLSHPKGGALAVVGHVERAWGYSFIWEDSGPQLAVFESTLKRLMEGHPIGSALEYFNQRYAELSAVLSGKLEDVGFRKRANLEVSSLEELEVSGLWTANNDARSYVVIGDPAVHLSAGEMTTTETQGATIEPIIVKTGTAATPTTAPSPEPPEASEIDYGLIDSLQQAQTSLTNALKQFSEKLSTTLKKAVDDVTSLEVVTYVSDDMTGVKYSSKEGEFTGNVKPWARTRINLDGDTLNCVQKKEGEELDQTLWTMHTDMVQRAKTQRDDMLKTLASVGTELLKALKGL